jgi:glucose-1-phosphate cytidylyltransferase
MQISSGLVSHFGEKNQADEGWINGGFFVLEPEVLKYINSPVEPFESGALTRLAQESQLSAYQHFGFWQPMDTLREKNELEKIAISNNIAWLDIFNS